MTHPTNTRDINVRSVYRVSPDGRHPYHWLEAGWENPTTIVLVHGLMAHSMAFRCVLHSLARRYRVIVPDLPAHGRDQSFREEAMRPDVPSLLDWLEGLLVTLGPERVHLVGHSLGATLSFLAARQADRFEMLESITLVSPGLQISVPTWAPHLLGRIPLSIARLGVNRMGMRLYEPIQWRRARMTGSEMDSYLAPIREADRLKFIMSLGVDLIAQPDRLVGASEIIVPTMVIWGKRDHLLPVKTAFKLESQLQDGELHIFDDCGHCPMEDCPIDFVDALQRFVPHSLQSL
ncbi:MAG: alpha/beta fold hydrolase [Bradymonadaceae bacterium]